MKAIIEHIVLVTRLLGAPVSEAALSAEVVRDKKLKVNYHSLVEVLRSHGFENTLSKRNLEDIPSLAVPVMIILHNEEAAVITIEAPAKSANTISAKLTVWNKNSATNSSPACI